MSVTFDAEKFNSPVHRQILGLGPQQTIGDWYDLLGIARFERDSDEIDRAMAARYRSARQYQIGAHAEQALEVIDELSRAYACLTSADARAVYEATIRGESDDDPLAWIGDQSEDASAPIKFVDCPRCKQPSPAHTTSCLHCGYRMPAELESAQGLRPVEVAAERIKPTRYLVTGVARGSGERRELTIVAWNETEALKEATSRGLMNCTAVPKPAGSEPIDQFSWRIVFMAVACVLLIISLIGGAESWAIFILVVIVVYLAFFAVGIKFAPRDPQKAMTVSGKKQSQTEEPATAKSVCSYCESNGFGFTTVIVRDHGRFGGKEATCSNCGSKWRF